MKPVCRWIRKVFVTSMLIFALNQFASGDSVYNVLKYGAVNDGKTVSTRAIQKAVDDCSESGGGVVEFPAGRYVSGTIFLKSNVMLNISHGAALMGSLDLNDYPVTVPEVRSYTDNYTVRSLIYGENLTNVGIMGTGIIDGRGGFFKVTDEARKKSLFDSYKARPYIIRMINCKSVNITEVTLADSPMWVQHYLLCRDLIIHGIKVRSRVNLNNDGIDIDACENVRISDCDIESGDDAIVLKSTLDSPCSNIVISNCIMSSDCNGFKLGTESNGGFHNISLSNCVIYNTRLAALAIEMVDGGKLSGITISNISMDGIGCPIFIRLGDRARPYREGMIKPGKGSLSGVMISGVYASNAGSTGCSVTGLPGSRVNGISLENIRIIFRGGGGKELVSREIEEFPDKYPEYSMFGMLPAYGFYCRHVTGLNMSNIELNCTNDDHRPPVFLDDAERALIRDLRAYCTLSPDSMVIARNCRDVEIVSPKRIEW